MSQNSLARLLRRGIRLLAALATALLIPVTNITVVSVMVIQLRGPDTSGLLGSIARDLARNPLLLAVGAGLSVNYAGTGEIPVIHDMTRILGGAALPVCCCASARTFVSGPWPHRFCLRRFPSSAS